MIWKTSDNCIEQRHGHKNMQLFDSRMRDQVVRLTDIDLSSLQDYKQQMGKYYHSKQYIMTFWYFNRKVGNKENHVCLLNKVQKQLIPKLGNGQKMSTCKVQPFE